MNEVLYDEAVIALSHKQTDEALKKLDEVLANDADHVQALELKAVTLNLKETDPQAIDEGIQTYEKLLTLKSGKDAAPYHFALAALYQKKGQPELARPHFEASARAGFNRVASRFFLGVIAFNAGENRRAEQQFTKTAAQSDGEMRMVSYYYLGLLHLKAGYPLEASRELNFAKDEAQKFGDDNKQAVEIKAAADQILMPYHQSSWFANLSFLSGYDSNIGEFPTTLASVNTSSGQSTGKFTFSGGGGYMTAPINTMQYVASYRASLNLNTSAATKSYEFASNTVSLFANYQPLAPTNGGIKVEGNLLFQNSPSNASDPNSSYQFQKYNSSAEIGPFIRSSATREMHTEFDLFFRPQDYYQDDDLSGLSVFARAIIHSEVYSNYFNPYASLSFEHNNAHSNDWKSNAVTLSLSNLFKVTPKDSATLGLDLQATRYPVSSLSRYDKTWIVRGSWVHSINANLSLLADLSYTDNISTVADSYSYSRVAGDFGVSWSL